MKILLEVEVTSHLYFATKSQTCLGEIDDQILWIGQFREFGGREEPRFTVRIVVDAESFTEAATKGLPKLERFFDTLSFTTCSPFRVIGIKRIIDWQEGTQARKYEFYDRFPWHDVPELLLEGAHLTSAKAAIKVLNRIENVKPEVLHALRLFRKGLSTQNPGDQYYAMWSAIETLSTAFKGKDKVFDTCSTCHSPLYCEKCSKHPKHKPYDSQAIERTILDYSKAPDPTSAVTKLMGMRNALVHGRPLEIAEEEAGDTLSNCIDHLAKIVHEMIYEIISENSEGEFSAKTHKILTKDRYHYTIGHLKAEANMDACPPDIAALRQMDDSAVIYVKGQRGLG